MRKVRRVVLLTLAAAVIAACGKSGGSNNQPLTYAPADTPYAFANLEPQPQAMLDWSSQQMQAVWPQFIDIYTHLLAETPMPDERTRKIALAVLDEMRPRDTFAKLREIGYKPDARAAVYGVGLVPVARIELSDPAAFKAMIARVEAKSGEKIAVGKTGDQEYWQFPLQDYALVAAVEGSHLVLTVFSSDADDKVKQLLLGLTKPDKNLLDAGTLQAIAKKYNYSPYSEGYLDFAALVKHFSSAPSGPDLAIAKAMKLPLDAPTSDPVCLAEAQAVAQKIPRLAFGTESQAPPQIRIGMQLETDPTLAQALMAALTAAPGTGVPGEGLIDFSIATPVLKLKDFALKQADAVAAKPFACTEFAELNKDFADLKQKLATTIPPPFSDLTGLRFTLDKLQPRADGKVPQFAARALIGSSNPLAAIGMAQMLVPQLKDLQIATDGKPVALPASLVPPSLQLPPAWVAADSKAIAIGIGAGTDATLGAYLAAPADAHPVFLRTYFSGALYGLLAKYGDAIHASMPPDKSDAFDRQAKLFALYEKMIRSGEFTFEANANGIGMRETVNLGN